MTISDESKQAARKTLGTSYREVPLKLWVQEQADKFNVCTTAIHMRLKRGTMPKPPMRRVNQRVVFVRVVEEL